MCFEFSMKKPWKKGKLRNEQLQNQIWQNKVLLRYVYNIVYSTVLVSKGLALFFPTVHVRAHAEEELKRGEMYLPLPGGWFLGHKVRKCHKKSAIERNCEPDIMVVFKEHQVLGIFKIKVKNSSLDYLPKVLIEKRPLLNKHVNSTTMRRFWAVRKCKTHKNFYWTSC